MNVVRRVTFAAVVTLMLTATTCADDRAAVATFEPVQGEAMAPFPVGSWVGLPASPVGAWSRYNWVFLADGTGFVHAGAARLDPDGGMTSTKAAAWFSFAERRWTQLPDLDATRGLGAAGGAWVGDTLVLIGQDCPPMTDTSSGGVEFCDAGASGAKVVLTYRRGDTQWRRYDVPDWIREYRTGTPQVLGVRAGRVLMASGHVPAHLGEFDPSTGDWKRRADAPGTAPTTIPDETPTNLATTTTTASATDSTITTTSLVTGGGQATTPPVYVPEVGPSVACLVGAEIVAWQIAGPPIPTTPFGNAVGPAPDSTANDWWKLDGGRWRPIEPPVGGGVESAKCSRHGVYISRRVDAAYTQRELTYTSPVPGTTNVISTAVSDDTGYDGIARFGDTLLLPALPTDDGSSPQLRIATPAGVVAIDAPALGSTLIGRYLVSPAGSDAADGATPVSQILDTGIDG